MNTTEIKNMEIKSVCDLSTEDLLNEFAYVNRMSKFYYSRKEEIIKEIERRTPNGRQG